MEEEDFMFESSQQSQSNESGKKKKKKSKKSRRNLDEDLSNAQDILAEDEVLEEHFTVSGGVKSEPASPSKKKGSKKKKKNESQDEDDEEAIVEQREEEEVVVSEGTSLPTPSESSSATATRFSPKKKKEPETPNRKKRAPVDRKMLVGMSHLTVEARDAYALNIIAGMSHDDVEMLLNKVGAECPVNDSKPTKKRETEIDWNKIAFSLYGPEQCRSAWNYLQNQTRKFRIMHELVEEVKCNLQADYQKFMRKTIEGAADFPRLPYSAGGFQFFCKEKWDLHKNLQHKMNQKVENFLQFQTQCHKRWGDLSLEQRKHYEQQAKLVLAEYRQKVREFYARYPSVVRLEDKLTREGKQETKEKPMSDYYRKQAVKMSKELYRDAPAFPLNPMQLYLNSKLNEVEPPPTAAELPELKAGLCTKWKGLSSKKKLKWIKKCIKNCEKYKTEVSEYKKTHPMFLLPREFQISKLVNKEDFNIWAENHGKPPKPKNTVYELFLEEFRNSEEAQGIDEEDILKTAEQKWKGLSKIEKDQVSLNFKIQQLNFRKEIEEYMTSVPDLMRASVIDSLPKKHQKSFLEEVDKEPLVKDEDLLEVDNENGSVEDKGTSKRKRKKATEEASNSTEGESASSSNKKAKLQQVPDASTLPLYAEDLGDEHKNLLNESMAKRKSRASNLAEQGQTKAEDFYPGKKITPRKNK